ncbi:hypothetical protein MIR68_004611 [Amoeboaphelidium protococcarum]|nr:hypothetical protein MIR68_004611 [Amoeboaphelidium protococcarum]
MSFRLNFSSGNILIILATFSYGFLQHEGVSYAGLDVEDDDSDFQDSSQPVKGIEDGSKRQKQSGQERKLSSQSLSSQKKKIVYKNASYIKPEHVKLPQNHSNLSNLSPEGEVSDAETVVLETVETSQKNPKSPPRDKENTAKKQPQSNVKSLTKKKVQFQQDSAEEESEFEESNVDSCDESDFSDASASSQKGALKSATSKKLKPVATKKAAQVKRAKEPVKTASAVSKLEIKSSATQSKITSGKMMNQQPMKSLQIPAGPPPRPKILARKSSEGITALLAGKFGAEQQKKRRIVSGLFKKPSI